MTTTTTTTTRCAEAGQPLAARTRDHSSREKPPPEPGPSAAKLNLAGIVWRKVWLAAAAVKDWKVHNTMHRGDTLRWLLCRQICVPQPLRSCRCPGAGAGEGEEAGNYSALIYDNIIHRLNVCELVKSGFSVSIPPVLGL